MFNPFESPSADFFGRTPFADANLAENELAAEFINRSVENAGYIAAAKRADKYRRRAAAAGQLSTGSSIVGQIGGAVAGAAVSAGIALI